MFGMKRNFAFVAIVLFGSVGIAGADIISQTQAYNLGDLIANQGSIVVEDKTFDNFSYSLAQTVGATGPDASAINVWGVKVDYGNRIEWGLMFQGGWQASTGQIIDSLIGFDVTVDPQSNMWITDYTLSYNGAISGGGKASIIESLYDSFPGPRTAFGMVFTQPDSNLDLFHDQLLGHTSLHVIKDVLVAGDTVPGPNTASISMFMNTFSQQVIPEPATMSLLALGGLIAIRRRR